jgi:hypothetical chaperone protein
MKSATDFSPGTLGLDFGTSNSAAAWVQASPTPLGLARALALEGDAHTLPTAVFYNAEDHSTYFGREAIRLYLSGTEGRLMRSLKSLLGSPLLGETTLVNGQLLNFQDIITGFLKELCWRATQQLGAKPERVVIGRPVHFVDDDPARDAQAQEALRQAAQHAGLMNVSFQLEPIAAALDYERRITRESLVLVVDIGGGTSDFTVVRLGPDRLVKAEQQVDRSSDVLATSGVHIGGTDYDQKLNLGHVMPLLGLRHQGPRGREVPSGVFHDLATWHLINWRYSPRAVREAQALRDEYSDKQLHQRLMTVLQNRLGHQMANEVEQAKINCSQSGQSNQIDLSRVETGLNALLSPESMGEYLHDPLTRVVACAHECVRRAGLSKRQLDAIYLTGGSSALIPFQHALQAAFSGIPLVEGDLFGGVAAGLAYSNPPTRRKAAA